METESMKGIAMWLFKKILGDNRIKELISIIHDLEKVAKTPNMKAIVERLKNLFKGL